MQYSGTSGAWSPLPKQTSASPRHTPNRDQQGRHCRRHCVISLVTKTSLNTFPDGLSSRSVEFGVINGRTVSGLQKNARDLLKSQLGGNTIITLPFSVTACRKYNCFFQSLPTLPIATVHPPFVHCGEMAHVAYTGLSKGRGECQRGSGTEWKETCRGLAHAPLIENGYGAAVVPPPPGLAVSIWEIIGRGDIGDRVAMLDC